MHLLELFMMHDAGSFPLGPESLEGADLPDLYLS